MKSLIRRTTTPFGAIIVAFVLLLLSVVVIVVNQASATNGQQQSGRLITIHDRGVEKVIMSNATTIGDALTEAGIELDSNDSVEPAPTEAMVASEYNINIYRARPVIIIDNALQQKIITSFQTAEQIAKSAGITLYPEDTTTLARTDDIVSEGAGLKLTIDRAANFSFSLYGTTSEARTQGETVQEMLQEKGITLTQSDRVVPTPETTVTKGMSVRVWREGKQTVTADVPINFTVTEVQDGDQYVGYRATKTAGQTGMRSVTYEITIQDGQEVGRSEIASTTTKQPLAQIDIVGAKYRGAYTTPTENENITWDFLIANGFSREQTAGIMGNLMQEHRFNTSGDGLAQWNGGRKAALMAMSDPYNIYTQLNFMMIELNGGYRSVRDAIKASSSVEASTIIFQNRYEKCNPAYCMQAKRVQYAYNILASH